MGVDYEGEIRITFNAHKVPWSYVGKRCLEADPSEATMALPLEAQPEFCYSKFGSSIVYHELGHALGMMHEHQNPIRGRKLSFDRKGNLRAS